MAASEHTGEMVPALRRFLRYHEQLGLVRQKVISASLYPALLSIVGCAVTLFLLCVLVPRFSRAYDGMHTQLPWASRWLMQWGRFAGDHWPWLIVAVAATLLLVGTAVARPAVRARCLQALHRHRQIGHTLRLMHLARYYRSLGMLLDGGVPLRKSLEMAQVLLPLNLQAPAGEALREVGQGRRLSDSLRMAGLDTAIALRLLRAGERNGGMAAMLEQAAVFHDQEVAQRIDRFTRLFEPALMLAIGLVIGGIVILLYLPIFEIAGSLR